MKRSMFAFLTAAALTAAFVPLPAMAEPENTQTAAAKKKKKRKKKGGNQNAVAHTNAPVVQV